MNVREILTKFGFDVDHEKLSRMEGQLEGVKKRLDFLSGVEVIKGLFELSERMTAMAEGLHIAAESAGLTVESFQKLAFSAKQNSVDQGEMEHSMLRLSKALYAARNGGAEATRAFANVGIGPDQVRGFKTSQDALLALADRFRSIKDPIEKQALAQQLLGRGSLHMVGYLSQGSAAIKAQGAEAQKLGIILSTGQVNALVKLEHALQKLWGLIQAIGAGIAARFAPVFEYMIADFLKLVSVNKELIEINVQNFLSNFAFGLGFVWEAMKYGIEIVTRLGKAFHLDGNILLLAGKIAGFVGGLFLLVKVGGLIAGVFSTIASVFGFITSPLFLMVTGITLLITAFHDLYAVFAGKPLWIDSITKALGVSGFLNKITDKLSDVGLSVLSALPSAQSARMADNGVGGGNVYNVQATTHVNVPPGTPPGSVAAVGSRGVSEHLDRVHRETRPTTAPTRVK